jgi:hypothetical protein
MRTSSLLALAACLSVFACGSPTVGDPCTTRDDCSGKTCLLIAATPGGYCSDGCDPLSTDDCPRGSVCAPNGGGPNSPHCLRMCDAQNDCRDGYTCRATDGVADLVCLGPG